MKFKALPVAIAALLFSTAVANADELELEPIVVHAGFRPSDIRLPT